MRKERSEQIIRIARLLTVNGEISRSDIFDIFLGNSITKEMTENEIDAIMKKVESKTKQFLRFQREAKVLTYYKYKDGKKSKCVIRGNTSGNTIMFKRLLEDLDSEGRAWEYYDKTFRKSQVLKSTDTSIKRHSYVGHCLAFIMDEFDIDVWKRPKLSELNQQGAEVPVNSFFDVKEVKNITDKAKKEFVGSTCTGILLLPDGIHMMYYIPDYIVSKATSRLESTWQRAREERFWTHVNQTFRGTTHDKENNIAIDHICSPYIKTDDSKDNVIIIGTDKVALSIMRGFKDPKSISDYIMTANLTHKIVYIRDNCEGKEVLKLLKVAGLKQKVLQRFFRKSEIITTLDTEDAVRTIEMPSGETEKTAFLFWLDCDLSRLYKSLIVDDRKVDHFIICCLASYSPLVRSAVELIMGKEPKINVEIKTLSMESLAEYME